MGFLLAAQELASSYKAKTENNVKIIDSYLLLCFSLGILQLIYHVIVPGGHYHTFLASFASCVASFVFTGNRPLILSQLASSAK